MTYRILTAAILAISLTTAPALARDGDKTVSGNGKDRQNRHETAKEFDAMYQDMVDPTTDPEEANFLEQQIDGAIAQAIEDGRLNKNYSPPGPTPCDCYK